jgi:hypothetical protein
MHAIAARHFIFIATCLATAPALASVGGTSSGVTSTVGTQGTNASPEVQQQSAGFVQQNQQLQDAQNPVSPPGIILPGGAANAASASAAKGAQNSANPGGSKENPGDPGSAQAAPAPATPPPPPPPPPTYVSVVKHLTPGQEAADPAQTETAAAATPVTAVVTPPVTPAPAKTDPVPGAPKMAAAVNPPAPLASAPANAATNAAKIGASERATEAGVVSGGRGPAPDGYTFYVGFGIALLLLVIAFAAYLSSQKDEAARATRR